MSKPTNLARRRFLNAATIGTAACGAIGLGYSLNRGIRYPTLGLEPPPLANEFHFIEKSIHLISSDVIKLDAKPGHDISLRAFSPQPRLELRSDRSSKITITINNVSPEAELSITGLTGKIEESTLGIERQINLTVKANQATVLTWRLPFDKDYTFASIGDSGGDRELAWCIQRAHQLGAKFLLHLGDFNYQTGDYARSVELFNSSPIPCFIAIGNHDFHDSGIIYPQFLSRLGPLNHSFIIGKTRFVNIDTAASMFPYSAGKRGRLLAKLEASNALVANTVSFTHRPLHDPLEGSTHDIGNVGERDWLISALKKIESKTLLSGHIHIYDRTEFMGIDNIIAGQGLGHQDILTKSDYSKMVLGNVSQNGDVSFKTEPLSMPMALHCHPRSQSAKDGLLTASASQENRTFLRNIEESCKAQIKT